MNTPEDKLSPEILSYYQQGKEADRLLGGGNQLEFARTQEIIQRYLPPAPQTVLDVGGGPGTYSLWLAGLGYSVHLVDPVLLHVEQAKNSAEQQPDFPLASTQVGDARRLDWKDLTVDAVLMLGPLYHLTERADRLTALREAARVLRPGGYLFAAVISRFASALDGLDRGFIEDPLFFKIMEQDLKTGQHRNPTGQPQYFTTAYFHHPDEVRIEIEEAGLIVEKVLALEGPACMLRNFDTVWPDPRRRELLLEVLRRLEEEPTLIGATGHLLAVGRKSL